MPSKKKKYNARFPAGRIKKIMQRDEEVGKVAQAVPIIISRTLELFVESLLKRAMNITISKSAKTLSPSHMKQCILSESRFDFLKDLVKDIPDVSSIEDMGEFVPGSTSTIVRPTTNTDIGYLPRTPSAQQPDLSMELAFPVIEQTTVMDLTMKTNKNDFDDTPTPPNFYKEITSQDSVIRYTPQTPEPKLITHSVHNIINKSQRPSKLPKQSPSFNTTDYPRSEPAYNIQISPTLLSENKFETDLDNGPLFHLDFTKNLGKPPPLIPIVPENNVNNPGNKPGFNPVLNAHGHQLAQHLDEDYDA